MSYVYTDEVTKPQVLFLLFVERWIYESVPIGIPGPAGPARPEALPPPGAPGAPGAPGPPGARLPPSTAEADAGSGVLVEASVVRQVFEETWIFNTANAR